MHVDVNGVDGGATADHRRQHVTERVKEKHEASPATIDNTGLLQDGELIGVFASASFAASRAP